MRVIKFYRTESGKCYIEDFLDSLTGKEGQKIIWVLKLIEEMTNVPRNYFKKLKSTDDLWEVRANGKEKTYRLLGFFDGKELIVLNHAFTKKTQKTPKQEIEIAQKRKKII
ncbi:MAG: type II toxin-antitoxin system RelE/ParE family toxin [Candidatus Marinimicrobia bacterium]|nr:type II toxin-antitoxin system RelE/ParE family toxin [Candidatus Neomarinimicrobiota bacterium]